MAQVLFEKPEMHIKQEKAKEKKTWTFNYMGFYTIKQTLNIIEIVVCMYLSPILLQVLIKTKENSFDVRLHIIK